MRILHTSDWHLGKRLFKLDRTQEHEKFLDWLLQTLQDRKIDILLIAGDIFDTPNPPHQSLSLFYDFLHRVSTHTTTQTYIIAGNHDSGLLLEAPSSLLTFHRVRIWGRLSPHKEDHWERIKVGPEEIDLCAIPFFRSHELNLSEGEDPLRSLTQYFEKEKTAPQLLMLHHLAGMAEAAGSEQVISLTGVESIPTEVLKKFDYVALGHIHKPQRIGQNMHYCGSPLPLRFSETKEKSVVILEQRSGELTTEILPIPLSRALIMLKVTEENWRDKINELELTTPLTPMVEVQMILTSPRLGLIDEIKDALAAKGMELLSFLPTFLGESHEAPRKSNLFDLSTTDLFREFYKSKYPEEQDLPADLMEDFNQLLVRARHASEEA